MTRNKDKTFSAAAGIGLWRDTWNESDHSDAMKLKGPIWIVGASGFIGANAFFSLSRLRSDVFAVSNNAETCWRLRDCPYRQLFSLDITRPELVRDAVRLHKPRTVFNFAAYGAYEHQTEPQRIQGVNYNGSLNLITALVETGCDAFVQAGTSSEYGMNCNAPSEDSELQPNSDYAVSKVATSVLLKYYGHFKKFPCTHLRLYSIYGPWEERTRLVPALIKQGLASKYPPFVRPEISRDFVFVDDCTRAFTKAALNSCVTDPGIAINIATGRKTTLGDVALIAQEMFSIRQAATFKSMPDRKWDVKNWYGNPNLAKQLLNWTSRFDFKRGLEVTLEWERLYKANAR